MKYILGLFHSIYFSYIGRFGGTVDGGSYYIWWTIHCYPNTSSTWKNCDIFSLRELDALFYIHCDT